MNRMVVLLLIFWAGTSFAQTNQKVECDESCIQQKFVYRFCDAEGHVIAKCSDNPNNEPGMKPFKRKIPFDVCGVNLERWGVEDNFKLVQYPPPNPLNPVGGPVLFDVRNVSGRLAEAANSWNRLCPQQGPDAEHQECCLKVRWTGINENIGMMFAHTDIRHNRTPGTSANYSCTFLCEASEMILNTHALFLNPDEEGFPRHYFVTERYNFNALPLGNPEYIWVDMQSLLEHELGHWLGFQHPEERDSYQESCMSEGSIMLGGNTGHLNNRVAGLTPADECMFRKLYCCNETKRIVWIGDPNVPPDDYPNHTKSMQEGLSGSQAGGSRGFTVAPNPATGGTITLLLHGPIEPGTSSIRIVDGAGNAVLHQELQEGSERRVSIDVAGLPSGMYMVQLIREGQVYGRKFLISE